MKARGLFGLMEVVSLSGKVVSDVDPKKRSRVWVAARKTEEFKVHVRWPRFWFSRGFENLEACGRRRLAAPLSLQKTR